MAGVLERIGWSPKKALENSSPAPRADRRILELQAAKEILAEIFGVRFRTWKRWYWTDTRKPAIGIMDLKSGRRNSG
jgi:hypothetical protein